MPIQHLLHDPVILVLLAASLASWVIIIDRLLALARCRGTDRAFAQGRISSGVLAHLASLRDEHISGGREHLATLMDTAITVARHRLEGWLPVLGVIGNTAAYVGLLGTVIGIIQAFQAMKIQNTMSTEVVASGIATALVATACGLAVAIPAVAGHHLLSAAINRRMVEWEDTAAGWLPKEEAHEPVARA
ncbi:MAG: Biopolymer transport protein ExbB [bacterium ADurb.Bin429]|nr:MAG: Biopolymer transport protein ExbB [bacterium ADurb.Bin429]